MSSIRKLGSESPNTEHPTPNSRENNLNALRLVLATLVMVSHAVALSYGTADTEPLKRWTHGQETFGSVSVDLFFLISGMFITASWFRSKTMNDFLIRRVLRIYPGFVVALTFSGLLAWLLCPEFRQHVGYGLSWTQSLFSDAVLLTKSTTDWPGIFARNPWPGSSNGSLWTIRKEFQCYLLVAAIGLFCLFKRRALILTATVITSGLYFWDLIHTEASWGHLQTNQSEGFASRFYAYFLTGMLVWLFRDKIRFSRMIAALCLAVLLLAMRFPPAFSLLFLPAGSYLVLCLGFTSPVGLTRWTQETDISYGVYLYAWPVQQVIAMFSGSRSWIVNLAIALPFTTVLAFLSWRFVEHRFLQLKSLRLVDYDPAISSPAVSLDPKAANLFP